jgi:hypothetical protein
MDSASNNRINSRGTYTKVNGTRKTLLKPLTVILETPTEAELIKKQPLCSSEVQQHICRIQQLGPNLGHLNTIHIPPVCFCKMNYQWRILIWWSDLAEG